MNKIIKILITLLVVSILAGIGFKVLKDLSLTDLNGNERIVSTSLDKNGEPKDIVGRGDGVELPRSTGDVYMSVKTNKKSIDNVRVVLKFDNKVIDDKKIDLSEAGYVTYHFKDLTKYKAGLYQLSLYDTTGDVALYFAITFK